MEEAATPDRPIPQERIYTSRAILVSTLLTGPIVGGYMLAENFRAFGERSRATRSLVISILGTLLLFIATISIPFLERLPPIVFSAAFAWTIYFTVQHYLSERMSAHFKAGGKKTGLGKVILVCVLGGLITVALAFGTSYLYTLATQNLVIKNYGALQHEIGYDPGNITVEEVDRIAAALTSAAYFDSEAKTTVDVTKEDGRYELFLYCTDSVRNNREAFEAYADLRNDVQKSFPDNKIVVNLVINTQDNVIKRLE